MKKTFWDQGKIWLFKFQILEVSMLSNSLIYVKRGIWLVFHQAGSSQNEQSLSLQEKTSESCLWASNTLVQKPCFLKFFSILKENCAANIINGTFKCKTFVGKCSKKRPLSKLYLPTKAKSFQSFLNSSIFSEFEHHFLNSILGKSIFEGLDGVEMWWGKKFIY